MLQWTKIEIQTFYEFINFHCGCFFDPWSVYPPATPVDVITVPSATITPQAIGQGTVKPGKTWSAIAQIKGNVINKHSLLNRGAILEAGSPILKIDPTDYQLAITQTKADIDGFKAKLAELNAKAANTRASLKIEQTAKVMNLMRTNDTQKEYAIFVRNGR